MTPDSPSPVRTSAQEPTVISDFCAKGEHGWCANRNYKETHCTCPCHTEKQEKADREQLARLLAKYPDTLTAVEARGRQQAEQARDERAKLAEAYMAGMRAACGQPPVATNAEPYREGRFNFQYQEGVALVKELLDEFARRADKAQDRADKAEAQSAALTQALKDYGQHKATCEVARWVGDSSIGAAFSGRPDCTCGFDAALTGAQV